MNNFQKWMVFVCLKEKDNTAKLGQISRSAFLDEVLFFKEDETKKCKNIGNNNKKELVE